MQESVDCLDDRAHIGFRTGSADAHSAGLFGQLFGQVNSDHQDRNLWEKTRYLPGSVEPIHIGHLKIQQNHVGRILLHTLKRFTAGSSFVANMPCALLLQERPEIVPNRRVVIDHENTNQSARPFTGYIGHRSMSLPINDRDTIHPLAIP